MAGSNRVRRPYVRTRRSPKSEPGRTPAARLAGMAGGLDRASVEALERRQMLFALTITPDDVVNQQTGLGTVTAFFGYTVENIIPTVLIQPDTGNPITGNENFDQQVPGAVGNGVFLQSGLLVRHNITPAGDISVQPPQLDQNARYLRTVLSQAGQFYSFQFFNVQPGQPAVGFTVQRLQFEVGGDGADATGLETDRIAIDLVFNQQVIRTFTGQALRNAFLPGGNPAAGIGTVVLTGTQLRPGFDTVVVRALAAPAVGVNPAFRMDNLIWTLPPTRFIQSVESRVFGSQVTFSGPVGARAEFRDLLGNDLQRRISLLKFPNSTLPEVDLDGNGFPDFNQGIGSIRFSGTDSRTSFSMWGGAITEATTRPPTAAFWDGFFAFTLTDSVLGIYDEFERVGFGYAVQIPPDDAPPIVRGLPPGPGSVVVGSPFVRVPGTNPEGFAETPGAGVIVFDPFNPTRGAYVQGGFIRADQGIFSDDGLPVGSISIHGVVHGSSRFAGAVDRLAIGYLVGSVSVAGDLGQLVVGSEAGLWSLDGAAVVPILPTRVQATGGQLVVGRTVGEIAITGRSLLNTTIVGDVNSPATRPARDNYTYYEKEFVLALDLTTNNVPSTIGNNINIGSAVASNRSPLGLFRPRDHAEVFGEGFFRNDNLLSAEYVGGNTSSVRIRGELSGRDPVNTADDAADVFAFSADGTQEVVIDNLGGSPWLPRIVDSDGRAVAAPSTRYNQQSGSAGITQFRFRPTQAGIYYLVLTDTGGVETGVGLSSYDINITGLAVTSLGAFRTGAGSGSSLVVLNGDVGSIRAGTGWTDGAGTEQDPRAVMNSNDSADDVMSLMGGTFSIAGTLYNVTAGGDIGVPNTNNGGFPTSFVRFEIGGNLGSVVTGLSPVAGVGVNEGDLNYVNFNVGGSIGTIDVRGGVGVDQDRDRAPFVVPRLGVNDVSFTTGRNGGRGDVGFVRVGFHVVGPFFRLNTPPGSTVGALLVSQDAYADGDTRSGFFGSPSGSQISMGPGSDLRFFDSPRYDSINTDDLTFALVPGVPIELIDDGGARVRVTLAQGNDAAATGFVVAIPVDGSQGVAIGRIAVNLIGGATLTIDAQDSTQGGPPGTPSTPPRGGTVGIGRIQLLGADANSAIVMQGNVQVDVYQIVQVGGDGFGTISNETPGGDIVAADVQSLTSLTITRGNLGRTQVPAWGPQLIGPFLGVASGLSGDGGSPLGVLTQDLIDPRFNGNTNRPVNSDDLGDGNAFFDDVGAPLDQSLNGLVVRTGDVTSIAVSGSVGDVILQGATARLGLVTANSDMLTAPGDFDGIVGNIYAFDIATVDVGDGLAAPDPSPFLNVGIVAADDVGTVRSSRTSGVVIRGVISSSDADPIGGLDTLQVQGVEALTIANGLLDGAKILVSNIDSFWSGVRYGNQNIIRGDIGAIAVSNSTFIRTLISASDIASLTLTNTIFDASQVSMTGNITAITATGFRNSTLNGQVTEYWVNFIGAAGTVGTITAVEDMQDLFIDVNTTLTGAVRARNIVRTNIDVDNILTAVTATGSIRASQIQAGETPAIAIAGDLQNSSVLTSGVMRSLQADRIINSKISSTGPDGKVEAVTARGLIDGEISASGPIVSVTSTAGDITALIKTTTTNGNVGTLTAGRDLAITADVSGNINALVAGRNLGDPVRKGVIALKGDLSRAVIPGQLHADIRAGGSIPGPVTIGQVVSKPERNLLGTGSIVAFGNVASVAVTGDFNGDIISYSGNVTSVTITDGSLLPGRTIAAYDGDITSVVITNGNLYGNIHADYVIRSVRVVAGADGVFGDVGVNPANSQFAAYNALRNRAPVGVEVRDAKQGPRITAGQDIASFIVTNGSVFEATFHAGRAIQNVSITGEVRNDFLTGGIGSVFAAGDSIDNVVITGFAGDVAFLGGAVDLGADFLPGGTGANADRYKAGNVDKVTIGGGVNNALVIAGVTPGADGLFDTPDDRAVIGSSIVNQIAASGNVSSVKVLADSLAPGVANNGAFGTRRTDFLPDDPNADSGVGTPGTQFTGSRTFNFGGGTVTLNLAGAGTGFFDAAAGRVVLRGTNGTSAFTVTSSLAALNNFDIVTNDDSSLASLNVAPRLTGDSDIFVDAGITTLTLGLVEGTGDLTTGGDVATATFGSLTGGFFKARHVGALTVTGDFGNANSGIFNEARVSLLSAGTLAFRAGARAALSVDRGATSATIAGATDRAAFRFGWSLGAFSAPGLSRTVLSVGDTLTGVTIAGEMFDSAIIVGPDLGTDSAFGGTGVATDRVTNGFIGTVAISGAVRESDIVTGYYRGPDGFYGTGDDTVAPGLGTIGSITVGGTLSGSSRNSESYLFGASGTLGTLTIGGLPFTGTLGNFRTEQSDGVLSPIAITMQDIVVRQVSRQYVANLVFNQPVDGGTLSRGLQISELRGTQNTLLRLVEGVDYTIAYDAPSNTARVTFSFALTERNLPQVPGSPGPGVFRFNLLQDIFRGKSLGNRPDGNGDGYSSAGDNLSQDVVVGDAGDKFFAERIPVNAFGRSINVDFYGPANLDWIMDNNATPDGFADPNRSYTVHGTIGDHPDNDNNLFRFAGDADVYTITLQAGQILRLGPLQGSANGAGLQVFSGTVFNNPTASVSLPVPVDPLETTSFAQAYLIKQTGVYRIVVGPTANVNTPGGVSNPATIDNSNVNAVIGDYRFTVEVFDDGDGGFSGPEDSGNGTVITPAPPPIDFAGTDRVFNTADDRTEIISGTYTFTLDRGADGAPNTADDVVSGTSDRGVTSITFADGRQVATIDSAIGKGNHVGVPNFIASDVDIFHLNNRAPIVPGTKMRITIKLNEAGADLGSLAPLGLQITDGLSLQPFDLRGHVQFGIFDTTDSNGPSDANLVFSPTDFSPNGGTPNRTIANDGTTKYGYDASGDFFIEFVAPTRMGAEFPDEAGTFAIYLQGILNTDYQIEVVTNGTGELPLPKRQNFFIETGGGSVDWLQAGGVNSVFSAFAARTLGFSGLVGTTGVEAQTYVLNSLVTALNALFQSSATPGGGYDVHFSTNPADFEFQPFSTIFLTSSADPIAPTSIDLNSFARLANNQFPIEPYGYSEHSDPLNADLEDEGVVFVPSYGNLAPNPGRAGVDQFVRQITAGIARRAGELMGLRVTANNALPTGSFNPYDPFAADSVEAPPGPNRAYTITPDSRSLSISNGRLFENTFNPTLNRDNTDTITSTDFFLGEQSSRSLLDKILGRI